MVSDHLRRCINSLIRVEPLGWAHKWCICANTLIEYLAMLTNIMVARSHTMFWCGLALTLWMWKDAKIDQIIPRGLR
ncbi:hypothetical protein COCMIDRAFT_111253 [Bipolaris oryzae ATCC 44560]|uniref:Uncharacterized protein n=1 Tax=Bipolaris oryzae ATCC 44560 TaxID=930090 RepID=W6YPF8_COCMI|nr:uncharacterized protein COCMIDRAFT_111253 [Bipolaris oryzae ATCC 44560]EUC39550.1 hypothetical protein COCMIDRAFT_111253 [Bipolaris oryzae ATCC 44560]